MAKVGISLGANLGDPLSRFREAIRMLAPARSSGHFLASPVFETAPVDCPPGSPPFHNAVIEIETEWDPHALLDLTQSIETACGRPRRRERNASRSLDLDLLYCDDLELASETLTLPHPRLHERAFVLVPLRFVRPDLVLDSEMPDEAMGEVVLLEGVTLAE